MSGHILGLIHMSRFQDRSEYPANVQMFAKCLDMSTCLDIQIDVLMLTGCPDKSLDFQTGISPGICTSTKFHMDAWTCTECLDVCFNVSGDLLSAWMQVGMSTEHLFACPYVSGCMMDVWTLLSVQTCVQMSKGVQTS